MQLGAWAKAESGLRRGWIIAAIGVTWTKKSLLQWLALMLSLPLHCVRARKHFQMDWLLLARLLGNTETWQMKIEVVIKM